MNQYPEGYDGYMEEEEEWDREGLLDPAWEKQQKKVSSKPVITRIFFVNIAFFLKDYYEASSLCIYRDVPFNIIWIIILIMFQSASFKWWYSDL